MDRLLPVQHNKRKALYTVTRTLEIHVAAFSSINWFVYEISRTQYLPTYLEGWCSG
jgi:hypothetical protein